MNEEQGYELIQVLKEIRDNMKVILPQNAQQEKLFAFNKKYKDCMRAKLYDSLTKVQRTLFFEIENDLKDEVGLWKKEI